jgi:hypothetical protein
MSLAPLQVWLVHTLGRETAVATFMRTAWGWPAMESLHFIALCLMMGTIAIFDLRLLGMAKRIPIAVMHRLIPWGLLGYAISITSGAMFLLTEPDQYIYNPAFHFKLLFMLLAGFNALAFYITAYRRTTSPGAAADAPRSAQIIAAISLCLWIGVITAGRLLTFYRPGDCGVTGPGVLAECIPR